MEKPIEETAVPMDPLLRLLRLKFTFTSSYSTSEKKVSARNEVLREIQENDMIPYYDTMKELFGWTLSPQELQSMQAKNDSTLKELDAKIKDAQENLGDTDVRDAIQKKCDYYARIGDLQSCLATNVECAAKTLAAGPKLDLCFQRIRLGLAFSDNEIAAKAIADAQKLMKDGDWERRNRLKVYEGLYNVCVRNFEKGSAFLLDALSTFASTELLDFKEFIFITVVAALITLSRADLKKKVIDNPEVVSAGITEIDELLGAINGCRYKLVFPALDRVCLQLRESVFLTLHVNYFFREMRVLVFNQFLDSYSSVTLTSMAASFDLPVQVLDAMLFTLISNERIACKIDRVSGNVTTYRGDNTNFLYHKIVKNGDILLNRIQKLSRLVEM